jgi:nitrogen regulatory protein P-II 1
MKEIKAYLRPTQLEAVIAELETAGARDMTVLRVDALGDLVDPSTDRHHLVRKHPERYSAIAKLEIVCTDDEAPGFVDIIRRHGHTGAHGDGRIFVSSVEQAINIRTGQEGEDAL